MKFSEEIRRHREQLGMTQLDLANMLGRSMQTVSNWECGRGEPWPSVQARVLGRLRGGGSRMGSYEQQACRLERRWRGPVDLGELP